MKVSVCLFAKCFCLVIVKHVHLHADPEALINRGHKYVTVSICLFAECCHLVIARPEKHVHLHTDDKQ